ncbi:hypothetical protein EMCRGX_G010201 [Ephydatia muelleri]
MLVLQGKLNSPSNFSGKEYTINALELTWTAPNSYQITDSPTIFYYTVCTDTAVIWSVQTLPRDSCVPFEISIFAVNGAGNGMVARTILERNNKISSYYEGQETMANSQPEALQAVQVLVLVMFLGLFFLCVAAHKAECRKHSSDDPKCQELGWVCVPLAVESYGNWGKEAQNTFARLASILSISLHCPKAKVLTEIYGRLNISLVRSVARAILSRGCSVPG